jgi:hypothetical protein
MMGSTAGTAAQKTRSPFAALSSWRHHYESVKPGPRSSEVEVDAKNGVQSATTRLPWRPKYLRRTVLFCFALIFALALVTIEVLLDISNKNFGVATSHAGLHYLWTYGPTAFLTLVAAVWTRVEYQSKMVAPWIRLSQERAFGSQRTVLLDYVSDFQLYAVFKSLRNGDFAVSITVAVSILVKILIVLSTGLITLTTTGVEMGAQPMVILDHFKVNRAQLATNGTLASYIIEGLAGGNLSHPNGLTENYAFQTVRADGLETAETKVTVDGFMSSLDCQQVNLGFLGANPMDPRERLAQMNVSLSNPGCNIALVKLPPPAWFTGAADSQLFGRFQQVQCDGTSNEAGQRMLVMFGNLSYASDPTKNRTDYTGHVRPAISATLHQSTQLLCIPKYAMHTVNVVRNGSHTVSVSRVPGAPDRALDGLSAWDLIKAQTAANANIMTSFSYGSTINVSLAQIDIDAAMRLAIPFGVRNEKDVPRMFEPAYLEGVAQGYFQQYGPIIAKESLMEPAHVEIIGSAIANRDRLLVRDWAAQWMAGLVAACLLLSLLGILTVPKHGVLPRNPSTIPAFASLIMHSPDLLDRLRGSGATDEKSLVQDLQASKYQSSVLRDVSTRQGTFTITAVEDHGVRGVGTTVPASKNAHPGVLHPLSRLAVCIVLVALIITLELMLRKSNNDNGIGGVGDDTYIHYTWTTLPAVIFGLLVMSISAMDFRIRALAPYTTLKHLVPTKVFTELDFLDLSIPRTMWKEFQLANVGALATTMALLIASLFTIFSGSLFHALSVQSEGPATLRIGRSFDVSPGSEIATGLTSSLIFGANLTFPRFTYHDLAFPQFTLATGLPQSMNASTVLISGVVPAIRPKFECRLYDSSKITTNLTLNYQGPFNTTNNPLGVLVEGEECGLKPKDESWRYNLFTETSLNATMFGVAGDGIVGNMRQCSDILHIWGRFDFSADNKVPHVAASGCNVSYEVVDVEATFSGSEMLLDPGNPPKPLENTVRSSLLFRHRQFTNSSTQTSIYLYLAKDVIPQELLTPFFTFVTKSPWAIPVEKIGQPEAIQDVADAIKLHHSYMVPQMLIANQALPNSTNVTYSEAGRGITDADQSFAVTLTDPIGARRVIQDAASTRVLESLIGVTLVLLVVSWIFMRQTDVLPRSPTSIASVAALIAGGNLLRLLPADAAWRSWDQLTAALGANTRFWVGWCEEAGKEGGSRFAIWASKDESVTDPRQMQPTAYQGGYAATGAAQTAQYLQPAGHPGGYSAVGVQSPPAYGGPAPEYRNLGVGSGGVDPARYSVSPVSSGGGFASPPNENLYAYHGR